MKCYRSGSERHRSRSGSKVMVFVSPINRLEPLEVMPLILNMARQLLSHLAFKVPQFVYRIRRSDDIILTILARWLRTDSPTD